MSKINQASIRTVLTSMLFLLYVAMSAQSLRISNVTVEGVRPFFDVANYCGVFEIRLERRINIGFFKRSSVFKGQNRKSTSNESHTPVEEGFTTVEVPVFISFPESALALQLSIVWPENELTLDTLIFSRELLSQNLSASFSNPFSGELRVLVTPQPGHLDTIVQQKDSIGFTIFFQLTDQFTGVTTIDFSSDFSNIFGSRAGRIYPTLIAGSISNADGSVSSTELGNSSVLTLYPNPVKEICTVSGLPPTMTNADFRVVDLLGRVVLSESLNGNSFVLPESVPSGTYWILLDGKGKTFVKPFVVSR